jgi:hypothetical protein
MHCVGMGKVRVDEISEMKKQAKKFNDFSKVQF